MATERQPTRPLTKVPQPRLAAAAPAPPPVPKTQPLPKTRSVPKTQPVPVNSAVSAPERPNTRVLQKAGVKTGRATERNLTSRSIPRQSKPPNPMLIVGGIVGALFFMVLIVAVAAGSGGTGRRKPASNDKAEASSAEPATLEREGIAKCEEGCALIMKSYPSGDKGGLQRGLNLVLEGNAMLERVNQMTGKKFDVKRYQETQVMARRKLMELK